jgi:hypothetical protein
MSLALGTPLDKLSYPVLSINKKNPFLNDDTIQLLDKRRLALNIFITECLKQFIIDIELDNATCINILSQKTVTQKREINEPWAYLCEKKDELIQNKIDVLCNDAILNTPRDKDGLFAWFCKYHKFAMINRFRDHFYRICNELYVSFGSQFLQKYILQSLDNNHYGQSDDNLKLLFGTKPQFYFRLTSSKCNDPLVKEAVSKAYSYIFRTNNAKFWRTWLSLFRKLQWATNYYDAFHVVKIMDVLLDVVICKEAQDFCSYDTSYVELFKRRLRQYCILRDVKLPKNKIVAVIVFEGIEHPIEINYNLERYCGEENITINDIVRNGHPDHINKKCSWVFSFKNYFYSGENHCEYRRDTGSNSRNGGESYYDDNSKKIRFVII